MTGQKFAIFDSAIGPCGIVWGERGIHRRAIADEQRGEDPQAHPSAQRRGNGSVAAGRGAERDRRDDRAARGQAERFVRCHARSRRRARIQPRGLRHRAENSAGEDHDLWRYRKQLGGVELSRDVGQALGRNPCPIVVPCHRVLAAGNKPGGFSANGGVVTKLKMLAIEGAVGESHAEPVRLRRAFTAP